MGRAPSHSTASSHATLSHAASAHPATHAAPSHLTVPSHMSVMHHVATVRAGHAPVHHPTPVHHVALHIGEKTYHAVKGVGTAAKHITASAAPRAFRATTKVEKMLVPVLNKSGNLRGMVLSHNARVVYNISSNITQKFSRFGSHLALAGIAIELAKCEDQIKAVTKSSLPNTTKALKIALIADAAALRSLTSVVPDGAHLLAKSMEGYVGGAEAVGVLNHATAREWTGKIHAADVMIKTLHQNFIQPEAFEKVGGAIDGFIGSTYDWLHTQIHFH